MDHPYQKEHIHGGQQGPATTEGAYFNAMYEMRQYS